MCPRRPGPYRQVPSVSPRGGAVAWPKHRDGPEAGKEWCPPPLSFQPYSTLSTSRSKLRICGDRRQKARAAPPPINAGHARRGGQDAENSSSHFHTLTAHACLPVAAGAGRCDAASVRQSSYQMAAKPRHRTSSTQMALCLAQESVRLPTIPGLHTSACVPTPATAQTSRSPPPPIRLRRRASPHGSCVQKRLPAASLPSAAHHPGLPWIEHLARESVLPADVAGCSLRVSEDEKAEFP
ncbi:hypothetical protein PHLGIDRAFT_119859 [Phlebiopsis gigantea 11061_1 CR5-6]|uniref:Uncharacterized protein n=1 Tax=Phlebiopsis gigantea (strain 11061_1 CR5-6) TaxID=745531 RepID=A0A0C3S8K9_PHLG1|nr:hypothetical protein PHLGIDRAFT_119859 [Phlebiopsis gigantea 11061_1 CR5-6]